MLRISVMVIFLLAGLAWAEPELKGTPSELTRYLDNLPKVITVNARGEIKTEADQAEVALAVMAENKSLKHALEENERRRGELEKALSQKGIPAGSIQAQKFSSTPEYGFFSGKVKNYRVTSQVTVTITTEKQFQDIAGAIDGVEEIAYQGIHFKNKKSDEYESQVFAKACEDASKRKSSIENALNVKLVPVNFIDNPGIFMPLGGGYGREAMMMQKEALSASEPAPRPSRPNFDEIIYVKEVQVEYKMLPPSK